MADTRTSDGMSLRDYFAAAALTGLLAADPDKRLASEIAAGWAYEQADAMLAARNHPQPTDTKV